MNRRFAAFWATWWHNVSQRPMHHAYPTPVWGGPPNRYLCDCGWERVV